MVQNPVIDCDDDEDNPWVWASEINSKKYGKFVWISHAGDKQFEITTSNYGSSLGSTSLKVCKSLTSAKKWVSMNIK